jgi:hypothetical protein
MRRAGGAGKGEEDEQRRVAEESELLEPVATTPARFLQLGIYAVACFMCAMDWNILVRVAAQARGAASRGTAFGGVRTQARCAFAAHALPRSPQAPVYSIGEARFDVGLQRINSLSNVRRGAHARRKPLCGGAAMRAPCAC